MFDLEVSRTHSTRKNFLTCGHQNRKPTDLSTTLVGDSFVQRNPTLVGQVLVSLLSTYCSQPDRRIGRFFWFSSLSLFFSPRSPSFSGDLEFFTQIRWRSQDLYPDWVEILSSLPRSGVDLAIFAHIEWRSWVLHPGPVVISWSPSKSGGGRSSTTVLLVLSATTRPEKNLTWSNP